jgi:SAM-dependent methyltransferase
MPAERRVSDVEPYSALPSIYDAVMRHVDYAGWAEFVTELIDTYAPSSSRILELGCGTGELARHLLRGTGFQYQGLDASAGMIGVAREKLSEFPGVTVEIADFTEFEVRESFDVVLLLYDGLNYLLDKSAIGSMMRRVRRALSVGGAFIVDQSTPANSLNNADFFEDRGAVGEVRYVRESRFDADTGLHHTIFDIVQAGTRLREHHVQRAYEIGEIERAAIEAGFQVEAALDGLTTKHATESSERVHWVLRRSG